ncbi:MAG: hypothetical protein ABIF10_06670 [Candidatus Woesearchaeota archaeon]
MANLEEGQVLARFIIEMLGAPREHVESTMRSFVDSLKQDKSLKVVSEDFAEPVEKDKLFATFVELEVNFKGIARMLDFCFEAMPSSVEIVEPASVRLNASELSGYLNDLQSRLHTIDMALKKVNAEHEVLKNNADALFRNLLVSLLKSPKTLGELANETGIKEEELKPLAEQLVQSGFLRFENEKFMR